jgi:transposase
MGYRAGLDWGGSAQILAELGDVRERFQTEDQLAAGAGVCILARAWIRILWRAWVGRTTYDPAKHSAAVQRRKAA